MIFKRILQAEIEKNLFKGHVIVLYGARQVGKTTILKEIQKKYQDNSIYFNCDEPDIRAKFTNATSTELKFIFGSKKFILLDEAQRVRDIGLTLKLAIDTFPEIQIIATGSSSFDLANKVVEPLTGRKREFLLLPFSVEELIAGSSVLEEKRLLEKRLIYGMYPAVTVQPGDALAAAQEIARSYSYKDILQYQNIRNPESLEKLLQALALQIGSEVSYEELARLLAINRRTVADYISILEKSFIVFRLLPLSRNPRRELARKRKIYFYDTGVRNALINNFNDLDLRNDTGALWENFWISERIKNNGNHSRVVNNYFWRSYTGQEIDYIEDVGGKLSAFECKWSDNRQPSAPSVWRELYPNAAFQVATSENLF